MKILKNKKAVTIIAISAVAICIGFIILLNMVIIPNAKYKKALNAIHEEDYFTAYGIFLDLGNFKDSKEKLVTAKTMMDAEMRKRAKVGDTILFGNYEQNNNTKDGKEPIEWIVLEKTDDKMLVISKYALDRRAYNTKWTGVTWETCTLRDWLNVKFQSNAFSKLEQTMILDTEITVNENARPGEGNVTKDKIFLLSLNEVVQYFPTNKERQCKATDYALERGVFSEDDDGYCWWWIRTTGKNNFIATTVFPGGAAGTDGSTNGFGVDFYSHGVRPAIWINLDF